MVSDSVDSLVLDAGVFKVPLTSCESMCICHILDRKALACSTLTPGVFKHRLSISAAERRRSWAPDSVGAKTADKIGGVPDCILGHMDVSA
jgi:hypothetical protein